MTKKTDQDIIISGMDELIGEDSDFRHPDGSPVGPRGRSILKAEKKLRDQGIDVAYDGQERGFSHRSCEMCGDHRGGDRHTLGLLQRHAKGVKHVDTIEACPDCVHYVANGELPLDDHDHDVKESASLGDVLLLENRSTKSVSEAASDVLHRINALGLKNVKLPGANTRANAKWENDDWELLLGDGSVGGGSKGSKWRAISKKHSGSDASRFSSSFSDVENHIRNFKK